MLILPSSSSSSSMLNPRGLCPGGGLLDDASAGAPPAPPRLPERCRTKAARSCDDSRFVLSELLFTTLLPAFIDRRCRCRADNFFIPYSLSGREYGFVCSAAIKKT